MKKLRTIALWLPCLVLVQPVLHAQKKINELSVIYNYGMVQADQAKGNTTVNASHSIFIKANLCRSELQSSLFSSTIILDAKTGTAVMLKEVSGQKLLIRMTAEDWKERNKRYEGMSFTSEPETKVIAGYKCSRAVARTNDGYIITVYFTRDLIPDNKEYDPQFKDLDGLPLEYELAKGDLKIKYTLSSINLNPVPASKFDIPKSGFREMTYDESKKLNVGN